MAPPHVDYENDNCERENETNANVTYNAESGKQCYENQQCTKGVEKRCVTKYTAGHHHHRSRSRSSAGRTAATTTQTHRSHSAAGKSSSSGSCGKRSAGRRKSSGSCRSRSRSVCAASKRSRSGSESRCGSKMNPVKRSAVCYDIRRGHKREPCTKKAIWQHGIYTRDMCGEGIVPKRYTFKSSRKIWCKTPLSMYQATIGELGRQLLCREKIIPRDVKPGPPCNIEEYILPPCRGYYRKYDCLRPCEEEHAVYKGGKKYYRDRVERYWEPCFPKGQKVHLNINEYAPQNAYLAKKMRRFNMQTGGATLPCW